LVLCCLFFGSDGPVLEEEVVIDFLIELAEPFEVLRVLHLVVDDLVRMLPRRNSLVLRFGLLLELSLQELSVVVCMEEELLICMEIIFISSDSFANIFLMAASLSSLISD